MALYKLEPRFENGGAWKPWYDKMFGAIVRAESEQAARELLASNPRDEGAACWLDPTQSVCVEVVAVGPPEVIVRDVHSA